MLLTLSLRPASGPALASWDELRERVEPVLPRVRKGFGVQEVWAHDRFFLRTMLTAMPSADFSLTVFCTQGTAPAQDADHPIWPLLARLAERNGWEVFELTVADWQKGPQESRLALPSGAKDAALPEDHHLRLTDPEPAAGIDLSDLDAVRWHDLNHAFGPAGDVPALIRAVASADPTTRRQAYRVLYGNIHHQGTTYEATVAAVPFFLRILETGPADGVGELLELMVTIGESDPDVVRALAPGEPRFVALASRGDEVALLARRAIACLARCSETAAVRLEEILLNETEPARRADWVHWLGDLPDHPRWRALLHAEITNAWCPEARLASALALARHGAPSLVACDTLFEAQETPATFERWSKDDTSWHVADSILEELAFDELTSLGEEGLAAAITRVGGAAAATTRWPALASVAFAILKPRRPARAEEVVPDVEDASALSPSLRVVLEVFGCAATPWDAEVTDRLTSLGLPDSREKLAALLARAKLS